MQLTIVRSFKIILILFSHVCMCACLYVPCAFRRLQRPEKGIKLLELVGQIFCAPMWVLETSGSSARVMIALNSLGISTLSKGF